MVRARSQNTWGAYDKDALDTSTNKEVRIPSPNVAYPRQGKTRQSVPDVGARRLGQDEQYLTVREILSEASTLADGALSHERSDSYRFGYATLGLISQSVSDVDSTLGGICPNAWRRWPGCCRSVSWPQKSATVQPV